MIIFGRLGKSSISFFYFNNINKLRFFEKYFVFFGDILFFLYICKINQKNKCLMMREIIVGIDFSNASLTALRLAVDIANRTGANLLMLWVETAEKDPEEAAKILKELSSSFAPAMKGKQINYLIEQGSKVPTDND
jgi:hypothetical protein